MISIYIQVMNKRKIKILKLNWPCNILCTRTQILHAVNYYSNEIKTSYRALSCGLCLCIKIASRSRRSIAFFSCAEMDTTGSRFPQVVLCEKKLEFSLFMCHVFACEGCVPCCRCSSSSSCRILVAKQTPEFCIRQPFLLHVKWFFRSEGVSEGAAVGPHSHSQTFSLKTAL